MSENTAFTAKAIARAQHMGEGDRMREAVTEYLSRTGRIFWDDARALFWVNHPTEGMQVAVWLMPEALKFEPRNITTGEEA